MVSLTMKMDTALNFWIFLHHPILIRAWFGVGKCAIMYTLKFVRKDYIEAMRKL